MNPTSPFHQFSMDATSSIPQPVGTTNNTTHATTTTTTILSPSFSPIRPPKIQLSFTDPLDWLFQADQFFQFYNIPWDTRLIMVAFYMRGDALNWFK